MSEKIKVVHYINQFYAGIGGEDKASIGISVREEPVGPGMLLKGLLGDGYEIVATIVCGDNHIAEHTEEVCNEFIEIIKKYEGQLFIAGPGFNAGRYGLGCGAATAAVTEKLGIPAVTALFEENPGTDLYKDRAYILKTENNAAKMRVAMKNVAAFAKRLVEGDFIEDGEKEGYHGMGRAIVIDYSVPACERGIKMVLDKFYGRKFQTEVAMPKREEVPVPLLKKPLSEIKLALVTDGGLVPKGNPDNMVPTNSKYFKNYEFGEVERLDAADYEVSHQGYNNAFVLEDPNRLVPVDAALQLKKEGKIGDVLTSFYTTAGVMTPKEVGKKFGEGIAQSMLEKGVDAAILTSTWGTSSRCGAVMTKEIERAGIPIIHVTNLTKISEGIGTHRILRGNSVLHVFGNPTLSPDQEFRFRKNLLEEAIEMLEETPEEGQYSLIKE